MVYYNDLRKKEHAFQRIGKDIKAGAIPSLVLLCGEEQYLIHWAAEQLTKKYINPAYKEPDCITIEAEAFSLEKLREACETMSMLSEKRVVLLPDFPPATGEKLKQITAEEEKGLLEYLKDVPETCLLIITAKQADPKNKRKSKLQANCEKEGKVYDFTALSGNQLRAFITKRFKTADKRCPDTVVDMLIESSGYGNQETKYNLFNLENDIKKLIAHSTDAEITSSDVALALSPSPETNVFAMLDAISTNRKDKAYLLLHNLLADGQSVYSLLALIAGQLELILEVKEMSEEGKSLPQIQKSLGVHQFRIKKALGVKNNYSEAGLKQNLSKTYEVDEAIKTGLLEPNLALELLLAEIN